MPMSPIRRLARTPRALPTTSCSIPRRERFWKGCSPWVGHARQARAWSELRGTMARSAPPTCSSIWKALPTDWGRRRRRYANIWRAKACAWSTRATWSIWAVPKRRRPRNAGSAGSSSIKTKTCWPRSTPSRQRRFPYRPELPTSPKLPTLAILAICQRAYPSWVLRPGESISFAIKFDSDARLGSQPLSSVFRAARSPGDGPDRSDHARESAAHSRSRVWHGQQHRTVAPALAAGPTHRSRQLAGDVIAGAGRSSGLEVGRIVGGSVGGRFRPRPGLFQRVPALGCRSWHALSPAAELRRAGWRTGGADAEQPAAAGTRSDERGRQRSKRALGRHSGRGIRNLSRPAAGMLLRRSAQGSEPREHLANRVSADHGRPANDSRLGAQYRDAALHRAFAQRRDATRI